MFRGRGIKMIKNDVLLIAGSVENLSIIIERFYSLFDESVKSRKYIINTK